MSPLSTVSEYFNHCLQLLQSKRMTALINAHSAGLESVFYVLFVPMIRAYAAAFLTYGHFNL